MISYALLFALTLPGQPPSVLPKTPDVGYIYPPAGRAGTTVDVRIAGFDWTPDLQFFFSDPRVKLELTGPASEVLLAPPPYWFGSKSYITAKPMPREIPARLTLPAQLSPGLIRWRVANANGASASIGQFLVTAAHDVEVLEDTKATAVQVLPSLPVGVSGRLFKIEEIDRYRFTAPKTGLVTADVCARRLGANFNAVLKVHDSSGRLVADVADTVGREATLTFDVQEGQQYTLSLHDVDFRGDRSFVYRLDLRMGPRVVAALPAAGRRGETQNIEFVGWGIASGRAQLESMTRPVTFPADAVGDSFSVRLETPFGAAAPFQLFLSDWPETVAVTPGPRTLTLPTALTAVLDGAETEHRYSLIGLQGETWSLAAEARRIGSPLDVSLSILNADGKELVRNDDQPGTTDAALEFAVPADGPYTIVVADASGHSGSRAAVYHLTAHYAERDFTLETQPRISVPVGTKADLPVKIHRHGRFKEAVALEVIGLPPGVTVAGPSVIGADKTDAIIHFQGSPDSATVAVPIQVVGVAKHSGQSHAAIAPIPGNFAPCGQDDNHTDQVILAVTMKPRCKVTTVVADGTVKVNRGAAYPAELTVERFEGFAGEIVLEMAAQQSYHHQGIHGPELTIPAGAKNFYYPCFMPEWLETTRTSRLILNAVAKVPDPQGKPRYLVTEIAGRITMSIEGSLLKVSTPMQEATMKSGQELLVPFKIFRSHKLQQPVTVALTVPEDLNGLLKAEPVLVPVGKTDGVLRITTVGDPRLQGERSLTLHATAMQPGNLPVWSDVVVPVEFAAK
jgi:hypothetical protein